MTDEDYEFNRIERESLMRMQAVKAAVPKGVDVSKEAISTERALKLALEALEWINRVNAMEYEYQQKARESLNAIYEAMAEQKSGIKQVIELYDSPEQPAQQEPVAWIDPKHLEWLAQSPDNLTGAGLAARQRSADMVSLYTSPPTLSLAQRKPLTSQEINQIEARWDAFMHGSKIAFVVRETEAAHGIKENT